MRKKEIRIAYLTRKELEMYNPFEEEFVKQVQKIRELRNEGKNDEADLEENTLQSMNQIMGYEDIEELEVYYE